MVVYCLFQKMATVPLFQKVITTILQATFVLKG